MHAEAAGSGRLDKVAASEQAEQAVGLVRGGAGQRGRGQRVQVGTRMQADQPERPRGSCGQVPVRPGKHRTHRGADIAVGFEQVKPPLLVGQLADQLVQAQGRAGGGEFGGHPQGERQPRALFGQHGRRRGSRVHPRADQFPQQRHRVVRGQEVQVQAPGR